MLTHEVISNPVFLCFMILPVLTAYFLKLFSRASAGWNQIQLWLGLTKSNLNVQVHEELLNSACLLAKYSELHAAASLCSLFLKNRGEDKRKAIWTFQRWIWVNISPLSVENPASEVFSSATANAEKSMSCYLWMWIHL